MAHLNRYKKQSKGLLQASTETQAVKKSSWSVLLKLFYELNLPLSSSSDTSFSFHAISQLIHQAKVIVLTTKVLHTALKQPDEERSRLDARVLLTSYLVLMCPDEVFQDAEGEDEKVNKSKIDKRLMESVDITSFCQAHAALVRDLVRRPRTSWGNHGPNVFCGSME